MSDAPLSVNDPVPYQLGSAVTGGKERREIVQGLEGKLHLSLPDTILHVSEGRLRLLIAVSTGS